MPSDNPDVNDFEVGDVATYHFTGSIWDGDRVSVLRVEGPGVFSLFCVNERHGGRGWLCPQLCTKDKFLTAARKVMRDAR